MPKQHVLFGRPLPRLPPRRISLLLAAISIFAVLALIFTLPSSIPTGPNLSKFADHKFSIPFRGSSNWPGALNPFRQPSHPPPHDDNNTQGDLAWHSDWKWLTYPFSSSVTLDENRSLLPPMPRRPPIYCYYDTSIEKTEANKTADSALLLTRRRAWWAQGFKPIILSAADALDNPMYGELQRIEMAPAMKTEILRWLAWEKMGGGLLANNLLFPMGSRDDPLLTFLRRGEYPALTRWNGLGDGLIAGPKAEITAVIKLVTGSSEVKTARDFVSALPVGLEKSPFALDATPKSLAFYDANNIENKYLKVADAIAADRVDGLTSLNKLINSHLHVYWQNNFANSIAVLKPYPEHTTHMIAHAVELAERLRNCSDTPLPSSCPPNLPDCSPCVAKTPVKIGTPRVYRNTTTLYTIGTVPHPYTLQMLSNMRTDIDIPWIRRYSARDAWISMVTRELLGTGVSGGARLRRFKEAVAGEYATAHSLWISAEKPVPEDIDYHFGFAIPRPGMDTGRSETPVPGPERRPQPEHDVDDGPEATPDDLAREPALLQKAKDMGQSRKKHDTHVRDAIEAWNLADTEAWRFARAFLARAHVERANWEHEEAKYAGGAGSERGMKRSSWGHWLDQTGK